MKTRSAAVKSTSQKNPTEISTSRTLRKCSAPKTKSLSGKEDAEIKGFNKQTQFSISCKNSVKQHPKVSKSGRIIESEDEQACQHSSGRNAAIIRKGELQKLCVSEGDIEVPKKPKESSHRVSLRASSTGDPFELKVDENLPPPCKRKFFSSQGAGRAKQLNFLNFDILRKKVCGYSRRPLSTHLTSKQTSVPRRPLSDEERMRIVKTTIWLPVPSLPMARQQEPGTRALFSTPVSTTALYRSTTGVDNILTSKPIIRIQQFDPLSTALLASPILPTDSYCKPMLSPVSEPQQQSESVLTSRPSVNYEHMPSCSPELSSTKKADRRTSFAEPSCRDKSNSQSLHSSSHESSLHSKSDSRASSSKKLSRNDDLSNYADWLEAFSAQLEPYESFNLSTD